jgi:uncharacterized protein YceK
MRPSIVFLTCLVLSGCGGPVRLDASTEARIHVSPQAMGDQLDEAKKKLSEAMTLLTMPAVMKAAFDKDAPKPTKLTIFKPFHGMTADEIIAKGQAVPMPGAKKKAS